MLAFHSRRLKLTHYLNIDKGLRVPWGKATFLSKHTCERELEVGNLPRLVEKVTPSCKGARRNLTGVTTRDNWWRAPQPRDPGALKRALLSGVRILPVQPWHPCLFMGFSPKCQALLSLYSLALFSLTTLPTLLRHLTLTVRIRNSGIFQSKYTCKIQVVFHCV